LLSPTRVLWYVALLVVVSIGSLTDFQSGKLEVGTAAGARSQVDTTDKPGLENNKVGLHEQFRKQMTGAAKDSKVNLGLAYWIELYRGGRFYRTTHFSSFHSGDQIRFHVLPNADGYAYIVMHKGTSGSQCVLFPAKAGDGNNFVRCGQECVVPSEGALVFDQVPGSEQVGLLLSRLPIDPGKFVTYRSASTSVSSPAQAAEDGEKLSGLEKSYDAIFGGEKSMSRVNTGALEVLAVDTTTRQPLSEDAEHVLASPSTIIAVNDDPDAVVTIDFALRHE